MHIITQMSKNLLMGQTGGDSGNAASRLASTLLIPLLCIVISAALSVRESFCFMQKTIQDDTQQPSARTDCWIKGTNLIN